MDKIVLTDKAPLYAQIDLEYKSTVNEFKAFMKVIDQETAFWTKLIKEVKDVKKQKDLAKGAKTFIAGNKVFKKVCANQMKLVKAKKAKKSTKKAFKLATGTYK
jgi:hypothetical protein